MSTNQSGLPCCGCGDGDPLYKHRRPPQPGSTYWNAGQAERARNQRMMAPPPSVSNVISMTPLGVAATPLQKDRSCFEDEGTPGFGRSCFEDPVYMAEDPAGSPRFGTSRLMDERFETSTTPYTANHRSLFQEKKGMKPRNDQNVDECTGCVIS